MTGRSNERVYRCLRSSVLHGELAPGEALTLRGLAKRYGTSMTPVREAIRRLVAEGALSLSASGRLFTPQLTNDRIEELASLRALLEPELAARALPRVHPALVARLGVINQQNGGDVSSYMQANLEFHRTLYLRAQAPAYLAMTETVWLQLGPSMGQLYARLGRRHSPRHHALILSALRGGDEAALRAAVKSDVTQSLRMLKS